MLQSQLFIKTKREAPKDEESINAQLLIRAGFVDKLMAGVYTFLPLGLRVMKKIENIIREEMNAIGGQEIFMPALLPKENWMTTGRWDSMDDLYKLEDKSKKEFALGATHEEIITPLMKKFVDSYKDLPFYAYQFQDKFRMELRSKSGLLRGREFMMKDLYSFHADENDLDAYYEKAEQAYFNIFKRAGLGDSTVLTFASGGSFSKYSHEFQTLSEAGEDKIYLCEKCRVAVNKEIIEEQNVCPECGNKNLKEEKGIEVGNIFKLGTKYSVPFNLKYKDEKGAEKEVVMGCYGIGLSRLMGTIIEASHDEKGIIWPEAVTPFKAHLINLSGDKKDKAEKLYKALQRANIEVLYDDREEASAGEKFADADLMGISYRLVISEKNGDKIEAKKRSEAKAELIGEKELMELLK
ncbi:MAG: aminoacyl--tRNA ligase-related protein [Candidatus Paceibacterota bacterium]